MVHEQSNLGDIDLLLLHRHHEKGGAFLKLARQRDGQWSRVEGVGLEVACGLVFK